MFMAPKHYKLPLCIYLCCVCPATSLRGRTSFGVSRLLMNTNYSSVSLPLNVSLLFPASPTVKSTEVWFHAGNLSQHSFSFWRERHTRRKMRCKVDLASVTLHKKYIKRNTGSHCRMYEMQGAMKRALEGWGQKASRELQWANLRTC